MLYFWLLAYYREFLLNDPRLGKLTDDGAAIEAGLKEGDLVHSIDDVEISSWLDVVEVIRENPDNELTFQCRKKW